MRPWVACAEVLPSATGSALALLSASLLLEARWCALGEGEEEGDGSSTVNVFCDCEREGKNRRSQLAKEGEGRRRRFRCQG